VVRLSSSDGEGLAALYRQGEVLDRVDEDEVVEVTVRLPRAMAGRLAARPGVHVREVV